MENIRAWILRDESVRLMPVLDRLLAIASRALYAGSYFIFRIFFRLLLGKKRRDKLFVKKGISLNYKFDILPVFYILHLLYFSRKYLRWGHGCLLKITVPRYNYKAYCPANKGDLINLTVREDEIIERFLPKEGDTVIDVGSHFGRYTLIASKLVGNNGKVISIEADPGNFGMLNRNINLNMFTNITTLNYAAYSKEANLKLYLRGEDLGYTIYNTIMSNRFEPRKFIKVRANTLDNLLLLNRVNLDTINWIKIDVEGAELEVLKGATGILSKSHNISVLIEIHRLAGGVTFYDHIRDILRTYDFKIVFEKIHDGGERHIIAEKSGSNNFSFS